MKKEDVIVLQYASNTCYTNVVKLEDAKIKGLKVDLDKGVWSFEGCKNIPVGNSRRAYPHNCGSQHESGIIGIYDKENIEHLNSMAFHVKEATEKPCFSED
jgi:hypothetical protein